MRYSLSLVSVSLLSLGLFLGCSSKEEVPKKPDVDLSCVVEGVQAPEWVCGAQQYGNAITTIGSEPLSRIGVDFTHKEATRIAQKRMEQRSLRIAKEQSEAFILDHDISAASVASSLSTQIASSVSLYTSKRARELKRWEHNITKDDYVLLGISQNHFNEEMKRGIKDAYHSDDTRWQEFKDKNGSILLNQDFPSQ